MHILFISQQWWPERGVPQRRMNWLVAGLQSRGHTVSVVTSPPHFPGGKLMSTSPMHREGSVAAGPHGEKIYRTRFREHTDTIPSRLVDQSTQMFCAFPVVKQSIADCRPDLIIATAPPIPTVMNAFVAHRQFDVPYIVDLRDAWPDNDQHLDTFNPELPPPTFVRRTGTHVLRALGPFYTHAITSADGLITTTHSHASELNARWGLRSLVLRNLAGLDFSRPPLPPIDTERTTLEVLYMGNIGRAQGLHVLLKTMEILKRRKVPVHVRLQGRGAYAGFMKRQARLRNLNIDVHSRVPQKQVQMAYRQADTLLVPLDTWDSLEMSVPSKLYETMLTGRHITAIASGETASIVRGAQAGHVVPPGSPIELADLFEKLQTDRNLLDTAGAGRRWLAENARPESDLQAAFDFLEATRL